jgi:hypothetical protein
MLSELYPMITVRAGATTEKRILVDPMSLAKGLTPKIAIHQA